MSPASKLKLNLSEAQGREAIPDDTYPATIKGFSDVKKGPKANYVAVEFEISEGQYEGRKFWSNFMVDGAAAGMFVDLVNKATGTSYKVEDMREEGLEIDPNDLIGAPVALVMKQEEYPEDSGEMRSQIKSVLAAGAKGRANARGQAASAR
jgi:hypothetical protein